MDVPMNPLDDQVCNFCGHQSSAMFRRHRLAICPQCTQEALRIIALMKKTYTCDFCGTNSPGDSLAEGPGPIHICQTCLAAAQNSVMN